MTQKDGPAAPTQHPREDSELTVTKPEEGRSLFLSRQALWGALVVVLVLGGVGAWWMTAQEPEIDIVEVVPDPVPISTPEALTFWQTALGIDLVTGFEAATAPVFVDAPVIGVSPGGVWRGSEVAFQGVPEVSEVPVNVISWRNLMITLPEFADENAGDEGTQAPLRVSEVSVDQVDIAVGRAEDGRMAVELTLNGLRIEGWGSGSGQIALDIYLGENVEAFWAGERAIWATPLVNWHMRDSHLQWTPTGVSADVRTALLDRLNTWQSETEGVTFWGDVAEALDLRLPIFMTLSPKGAVRWSDLHLIWTSAPGYVVYPLTAAVQKNEKS